MNSTNGKTEPADVEAMEEKEDEFQLAARKLAESCAASTSGESSTSGASATDTTADASADEVAQAMEASATGDGLDTDEGFFDKPAVSPDSLAAASPTLLEESSEEDSGGSSSDT